MADGNQGGEGALLESYLIVQLGGHLGVVLELVQLGRVVQDGGQALAQLLHLLREVAAVVSGRLLLDELQSAVEGRLVRDDALADKARDAWREPE